MSTIELTRGTRFLEYSLSVGMTTMEGRGFYYPTDTAVAANGRLYVANRSLDGVVRGVRVTMCDVDGEYYGTFGSYGEEEGQFIWPSACASDAEGRVYVSDEYTHQVSVFDGEGRFLTRWGKHGSAEGELDTPSGLASDRDGSVYVADTYNHRVQKFTADGRFLSGFGSRGDGPGEFDMPWGLTVDTDGQVYVADWRNDRIQKFSPDGSHLAAFGSPGRGDGEFHRPSGVAVDANGYIYVSDWGNERVQILDSEGGFIQSIRGESTLSTWAANFLKINEEEGAARSRANLEPEIEYFVDEPHEESSHIEKLFWSPVSVKLDPSGNLYVTESNRHRIQIFKPSAQEAVAGR